MRKKQKKRMKKMQKNDAKKTQNKDIKNMQEAGLSLYLFYLIFELSFLPNPFGHVDIKDRIYCTIIDIEQKHLWNQWVPLDDNLCRLVLLLLKISVSTLLLLCVFILHI